MEQETESNRKGTMSSRQTHDLIVEMLPDLPPDQMQTIFFQTIEHGPESLLVPIEAEFARRGLSPYATYSTDSLTIGEYATSDVICEYRHL